MAAEGAVRGPLSVRGGRGRALGGGAAGAGGRAAGRAVAEPKAPRSPRAAGGTRRRARPGEFTCNQRDLSRCLHRISFLNS